MNNLNNDIPWPPPYHLKKHKRAKSVKLRASQSKGLVVTIPNRFSLKHLPEILETHKEWILKHLSIIEPKKIEFTPPTEINLLSINRIYKIFYVATEKKLMLLERPNQEIILIGKINDNIACKKLLLNFIKLLAKKYLPEKLYLISQAIKLPYSQSTVRSQNTLWGSCTRDKNISLNYKLIFLPPHLMNHIFIHELCHTKYMNHSEKFWNLVASFDPDWRENRKSMRQADALIPEWI